MIKIVHRLESQEKFIEDDLSDDGGDNGTVVRKWSSILEDIAFGISLI